MSLMMECSVFPNGEIIKNDLLLTQLQVVYDLLETYDGRSILFHLLFKIKYGKSTPGALTSHIKNYKESMLNDLKLLNKDGSIPKALKNTLTFLEEENGLFDKLGANLFTGKRFNFKLTLSLDQYDPKTKKVYHTKGSVKAYRNQDFKYSPSMREFLEGI